MFIAFDPDEEVVFNPNSQSFFFKSVSSCKKAIAEELDEPYAEDEAGVSTMGEDAGWSSKDYKIFKLLRVN